jgi:hypothetical protein
MECIMMGFIVNIVSLIFLTWFIHESSENLDKNVKRILVWAFIVPYSLTILILIVTITACFEIIFEKN